MTHPRTISGPRTLEVKRAHETARMREYRVTLDGVPTRAIEIDGDGPTALLLHGFCDSADTWRSVIDRLRERGRRAIAVDMPGYGYAKPSHRSGNLLERQTEFTAEVIKHLEDQHGDPVVVAGNSLGGWTALRVGARAGELPIAGIVPVAPAGLEMSPWFFRADRIPGLAGFINLPAPVSEAGVRRMIERVVRRRGFGARERIDEGYVRSFAFHNRSRRKVLHRIRDARQVVSDLDRPYDAEALSRVPSVIVWGDRDPLCLPHGAPRLAEDTGGELVMIERCGHMPQVETPDIVVEAIEKVAAPVASSSLGRWRRG